MFVYYEPDKILVNILAPVLVTPSIFLNPNTTSLLHINPLVNPSAHRRRIVLLAAYDSLAGTDTKR